jgi:hypothetical protein
VLARLLRYGIELRVDGPWFSITIRTTCWIAPGAEVVVLVVVEVVGVVVVVVLVVVVEVVEVVGVVEVVEVVGVVEVVEEPEQQDVVVVVVAAVPVGGGVPVVAVDVVPGVGVGGWGRG